MDTKRIARIGILSGAVLALIVVVFSLIPTPVVVPEEVSDPSAWDNFGRWLGSPVGEMKIWQLVIVLWILHCIFGR